MPSGGRLRPAAWLAVAALLAAGCGTRLPDAAFGPATPAPGSPAASSPAPGGSTDTGVSAGSVTIGNIVSRTNPVDPSAFIGPYYGLKAFVDATDRAGGIAGRRLVLKTCDDHGTGTGDVACVHQLVDADHVFALVANAALDYAGAPLVNAAGVPDIGSQPISNAYTQYPHLWDIYGESYPRNGKVGFDGTLRGGTEVYHYFKVAFPKVALRAGIVYYNQSSSQKWAGALAAGLRAQGYTVTSVQINFALPDWNSAVLALKHDRVSYVYDAMDLLGNEGLCRAMDANRLYVTAKVTTTQSWAGNIAQDYSASPHCRNSIYATGDTRNYEDTRYPAVAAFRAAMAREGWNRPQYLSEWALEGWAGAQWFADAAASCGRALTRRCVEAYLDRPTPYDGHGLLTPRSFQVTSGTAKTAYNCLNVARWQDAAYGGRGGWVTQVPDMDHNCFTVPVISYRP